MRFKNLSRTGWETYFLLILYFAMAVFFQWRGGVFQSEFGGHPDEAAHYVTGLMARDYLLSGFHQAPMKFAQEYYKHYPKVGLGNWPPVFYIVQAAWMVVFPASRDSALLLIAFLAAALGGMIFRVLREEYSLFGSAAGGALFLALPLVQQFTGMIMAEILTGLMMFAATLYFGRFLETGSAQSALLFGVFAALAILTKGNGLALVLMAGIALCVSGRLGLLKKKSIWISALLVLVLAGPWMWMTRDLAKAGWVEAHPSWHFTRAAIPYYLVKFESALGIFLVALILEGIGARYLTRDKHRGKWAALFALMAAVIIFQWIAPVGFEARHLIPALVPAALFAIAGIEWIGGYVARFGLRREWAMAVTYGAGIILFCVTPFQQVRKGWGGFEPVVRALEGDALDAHGSLLVSSDASGEGMFIAEMAAAEGRPGHFIDRASKDLASSTWSGGGYHSRFENEAELEGFLKESGMHYVVLDNSMPARNRVFHHDLLLQTLNDDPADFRLIGSYPIRRAGVVQHEPIRLYEIAGH